MIDEMENAVRAEMRKGLADMMSSLGNFNPGGLGAAIATATANQVTSRLASSVPSTPQLSAPAPSSRQEEGREADNAAFLTRVLQTVVKAERCECSYTPGCCC